MPTLTKEALQRMDAAASAPKQAITRQRYGALVRPALRVVQARLTFALFDGGQHVVIRKNRRLGWTLAQLL